MLLYPVLGLWNVHANVEGLVVIGSSYVTPINNRGGLPREPGGLKVTDKACLLIE